MNLLEVMVVLAVTLSHAEGNPECDQAQEEATACQANAVATYKAEEAKSSGALDDKWLEGAAKRDCRFVGRLNTCIDDSTAVCPHMLKTYTNIVVKFLDTVQENKKWDTEKCPGALALKAKEGKILRCEAAEAEFFNCHEAAERRLDVLRAEGTDGKDNFLERKVCNWITEDYEQCLKQRVESNCGYDQNTADLVTGQAIDKIQSTFPIPEWVSEKCPTARNLTAKLDWLKDTSNKSNEIKQSSLLSYALMASALITSMS